MMSDEPIEKKISWLEKLTGIFNHDPKNKEALLAVLNKAVEKDLIDYDAFNMIEGVLNVANMTVADIMVPRSQMAVVQKDQTPKEFLPTLVKAAHSRFPVIGDSKDEVIGILLAKDVLKYFAGNDEYQSLETLIRPATFVPESKKLDSLLHEFRSSRTHLAVVVDEYGNVSGVVTIEDVLEEIVGDIEDEFDVIERPMVQKLGEHTYIVDALTPIDVFNTTFNTQFSTKKYDTIGGLVLHTASQVPKINQVYTLKELDFKVIDCDGRRIKSLLVTKTKSS